MILFWRFIIVLSSVPIQYNSFIYERKEGLDSLSNPFPPKEDCALKELYEKRGVKKWAEISRLLEAEYGIPHRNGKQCR